MKSFNSIVAELKSCSRIVDGTARDRKLLFIKAADECEPEHAGDLLDWHETLLFIAAFPDDAEVHQHAERSLARTRRIVEAMRDRLGARALRPLVNSGVAGTMLDCAFTLDGLRWLAHRFPRDVDVVWDDDSLGSEFESILSALVSPVEYDGLLDPNLSVREWLKLGGIKGSALRWIVDQFERLRPGRCKDAQLLDRLFDQLELHVRWSLREPLASRTTCRFPSRPLFSYAPGGRVAQPPPPIAEVVGAPLPVARKLTIVQSKRLLDVARAALASRSRETDPVTYAEPRDVTLLQLERGIDILLLGMTPERRLPIEGFIGHMVAKNRIPIAYGGGWVAFDTCAIGINLFETFRGGESAHIFAQVLRAFRDTFNVRSFRVDPYQYGEGNEEAIRSGAFWFYYRFGFRPVDPDIRELASREAAKIAADRSHRTSLAMLRRFATGGLQLDLVDRDKNAPPAVDVTRLSLAATNWIAHHHEGDRAAAQAAAVRAVSRALGVTNMKSWPQPEQDSFASLAVIVAMIPDLSRWSRQDRLRLVALMRSKGGPWETAYLHRLRLHPTLQAACAGIANQVPLQGLVSSRER